MLPTEVTYWKRKYRRRWKVAKDMYKKGQKAIEMYPESWSKKWTKVYIAYNMRERVK